MAKMSDAVVSDKIMQIRIGHGGDSDRCPTCCRPSDAPYRSQDAEGRIVQGCIDAIHTRHMASTSATAAWHNRPVAKERRRIALSDLLSL